MWVFIYCVILIYVYSLIGFAFYREMFVDNHGYYCRTMYECMLTVFHMGPIRGLVNVSSWSHGTHQWTGQRELTVTVFHMGPISGQVNVSAC